MSFFNKLKTFPEYHNAHNAIIEMLKDEEIIIHNLERAFGKDFIKFIDGQPAQVSDALKPVRKCALEGTDNIKKSHLQTGNVANEFQQLYTMYNELVARQYLKNQALQEASDKKTDLERKRRLLEKERSKGQGEAYLAAERNVQRTEKALEKAKEKADKAQSEYNQQESDYKTNFGLKVVENIQKLVESRKLLIEKNIQTADLILESAKTFSTIKDDLVPKLEDRLRQWETHGA